MYRDLTSEDVVEEGDEVLNEFLPCDYVTWHSYVGFKVLECKGFKTGNQRVFRRPLKSVEGANLQPLTAASVN